MTTRFWFEELKNTNGKYVNIQRADRTWLVRDDTKLLKILPCHHVLSKNDYAYQLCTITSVSPDPGQKKCWVPLIPGYSIMTKIGSHFFQLSINESNNVLQFEWIDYVVMGHLQEIQLLAVVTANFFNLYANILKSKRTLRAKYQFLVFLD